MKYLSAMRLQVNNFKNMENNVFFTGNNAYYLV